MGINRREFLKGSVIAGGTLLSMCACKILGVETSDVEEIITTTAGVDNKKTPPTAISSTLSPTPGKITATRTDKATEGIPDPTKTETPMVKENRPFDPSQKVPVLEHHNPSYGITGETGPETCAVCMTEEVFEGQLKTIKKLGFSTPSEEEIMNWMDRKAGLDPKSVIIRIDIGVPRKDYESQFVLLEKYGYKAILFILTGYMQDESTSDSIGWDVIKKYVDKEVLIPASHGTWHPDYSQINREWAMNDSLESKNLIEDKLGRPIYFFAFPEDKPGHEGELLEHYKALFSSYGKKGADANDLTRIGTIYPYIRKGSFDWEEFEMTLIDYSGVSR